MKKDKYSDNLDDSKEIKAESSNSPLEENTIDGEPQLDNLERLNIDTLNNDESSEEIYNEDNLDYYEDYYEEDPKKARQKKVLIIGGSIFLIVFVLLITMFLLPRKEKEYGELAIEKSKALYVITYSSDNLNEVELMDNTGNLKDSYKGNDLVYKASEELSGLFVFNNESDKLSLLTAENDKLKETELINYPIEEKVLSFFKSSKYVVFVTEKELIFVSTSDSKKITSVELKKISESGINAKSLVNNCYLFEDKFYFIDNSKLYMVNILNSSSESMDFYKNNLSLYTVNDKLYLFNEFGSDFDQNQIFIVNPSEFKIDKVITLNSSKIISLKNKLDDTHIGVFEVKQGESKENFKFYMMDDKDKVEFVLPGKDFSPYGASFCTKGYMYFINNTSTTENVIKILDIYSLEENSFVTKNTNFLPLFK